jgi:sialate O-acetylesterase
VNEIRLTNLLLRSIDGKTKRSFAYQCGDTKIGDSSYFDQLRNEFTGARGVKSRMLSMETVDLYDIDCYSGNGQTGEELISLVKQAEASHTLIVFLFHGVGGGHSLNISLEAHSKLIHYLKQKEKEIWIAPMTEVAEYIRNSKSSLKKKS